MPELGLSVKGDSFGECPLLELLSRLDFFESVTEGLEKTRSLNDRILFELIDPCPPPGKSIFPSTALALSLLKTFWKPKELAARSGKDFSLAASSPMEWNCVWSENRRRLLSEPWKTLCGVSMDIDEAVEWLDTLLPVVCVFVLIVGRIPGARERDPALLRS